MDSIAQGNTTAMTIYQEKFGFVYIWYDRKHKRFYIGSHWGFEDDGYICSSNWMRHAYRRRPQDFKRRILTRYYGNRRGLYDIEQKWLDLIKPEELAMGKNDTNESTTIRYYNFNKKVFIPWHSTDEGIKIVGEKISKTNKGKVFGPRDPSVGKNISITKTKKFAERQEKHGYKFTPEHCASIAKGKQGYKHTEEWKANNAKLVKEQWANGVRKGKPHTEEWKKQNSIRNKGKKLSSEQVEMMRINNYKSYIIVYDDGRTEEVHGLKKFAKESGIPYVTLFKASKNSTKIKKYSIKSITVL
jgi:hypothetical protein